MKKVYFLLLLVLGSMGVWGQVLTENFSYTAGQLITANGWTAHNAGGTNAITVTSPGLTYAGHPGSGVGNAVTMTTSGEDDNKALSSAITTGSAYTSFLVNVSAAQATGDYFVGLLATTSTFPIRIYAKSTTGGFFFGISKNGAAGISYETTVRTFGTTYFIVANYIYNTGTATDDVVNLWVNPTLGAAEPAATIANVGATGADLATIIAFYLRQGNAANASTQQVDAILVGTTWAQVTPLAGGPTISVTPSTLTGFTALSGVPTAEQTYTVDGASLTNDIVITPPVGFEIATATGGPYTVNPSFITLTQSGGTVPSTTIYVRMNSTTVGTNTGNITHTSAGSNNPNVSLTGSVITTEPAVQSAITIPVPTVTTNSMVVNFSGGDGAKRILVARSGSAVNSDPVDGTTYTANSIFGAGTQIGTGNYVVYTGTGNTVTVTGLAPTTTYHFAVYEYNDVNTAGAENYLTVAPGLGNATTLSTDGDFRSIATGNWSDIAIWQERVANNWVAATTAPLATTNVYIQAAHTVTVDIATATCNDLHINAAASSVLAIGTNTVEVNGKLRAYTGTAVIATGPDGTFYTGQTSTTGVGSSCITSTAGSGKMKVVGNTRTFTATGEWGNNPPGWDIEFAPAAGQILTMQTGFKAANITVASGTLLNTNTDLRPDGGGAGLGSVTVKSGATLQFSNILISIQRVGTGSGTSHFGTLTVEAGGIMEFSGTSSPVIGAATFALNGTVIYSGAGNQTLAIRGTNTGGVQPNTYTNLTIDGGGNKTLPFPIAINGTLNLISGYVINNITDLLTMNSGSSATGASNSSFVNGPVAKTGSTNFEFPVGKTGTGYVPISIGNLSASETFTAEYIRADALGLGTITAPGLAKVSRCEYWTLNRTGAATTADVTLHWSAVNNCGVLPYIVQMADLTVAHFDGTNWDAFGPAGLTTGLPAAGTVTWQNVSTFSPFTIGSISFLNPLPIVVNYLQGTKQGSSHHLNWKVTCNSTPTATMVLERSADNRNFAAINTVTADALRCAQPFNYVDASPLAGVNYYRLRITDANGKVTFSNTIAMVNKLSCITIVGINPNPVTSAGAATLSVASAQQGTLQLVVSDIAGRRLLTQTEKIIAGSNQIPMNFAKLSGGSYQITAITEDGKATSVRFVKQ